jgi:putative transposase
MNNHYHLLIETPQSNLSSGMHLLNGVYTPAFNRKHSRVGHLFQGRFKSILVEKESYLLELVRYILLNPVRAGLVHDPEAYRWSSYNATVGLISAPGFLHIDWILDQFGNSQIISVRSFVKFMYDTAAQPTANTEEKTLILGSREFMDRVKPYLLKLTESKEIPKHQRLAARPELAELFMEISSSKAERNRKIVQAFFEFGYTQTEIALSTGLHYSTISKITGQKHG